MWKSQWFIPVGGAYVVVVVVVVLLVVGSGADMKTRENILISNNYKYSQRVQYFFNAKTALHTLSVKILINQAFDWGFRKLDDFATIAFF